MARPGLVKRELTDRLGRRTSRWVRPDAAGPASGHVSTLPPSPRRVAWEGVGRTAAGRTYDLLLVDDVAVGERFLNPFTPEEVPSQVDHGWHWLTLLERESDGYVRVSDVRGKESLVPPGAMIARELDDDGVPTRDPSVS